MLYTYLLVKFWVFIYIMLLQAKKLVDEVIKAKINVIPCCEPMRDKSSTGREF